MNTIPISIPTLPQDRVRERGEHLTRLVAGMREAYRISQKHQHEVEQGLRRDNAILQQQLAERRSQVVEQERRTRELQLRVAQLEYQRREVLAHAETVLREQGEEVTRLTAEIQAQAPTTAEWARRLEVAEREAARVPVLVAQVAELQDRLDRTPRSVTVVSDPEIVVGVPEHDLGDYEAELVRFHRCLQVERAELEAEKQRLRDLGARPSESGRRTSAEVCRLQSELRSEALHDQAFATLTAPRWQDLGQRRLPTVQALSN